MRRILAGGTLVTPEGLRHADVDTREDLARLEGALAERGESR